ncbi:MAG: polysaccharide deacetylase family protein [Clostridia bacterium]|nr:polysaccharide deacetylase family protein [Clostridia bacterium]
MWKGKKKAITLSFDDGTTQDIRFVEILDKYDLKATFNLNSCLLGKEGLLERHGRTVRHDKILPNEVKDIYKGHEVAVHTLTHPNLTFLGDDEVVWQVEEDRKNLSELCGYEVVGMAYPCGGKNNDERVAQIVASRTGVKYARTITSTYQFDSQSDLFRFNPTVHFIDEDLDNIVDRFLSEQDSGLLYIWGHSFELDAEYITWEKFEKVCKKLARNADVFYGTNKEVLLKE